MNLKDKSYQRIRELLTKGQLKTKNGRISINELAQELNMSRTPVRDAIQQLASEGLVESVARSGVVLKAVTYEDLKELVELRQALDPFAAAQAANQMHYAQKRRLRRICEQMRAASREVLAGRFEDPEANRKLHRLDVEFHQRIMEATGNQRIQKIVEDYHLLTKKVRYPSQTTIDHLALTLYEHWRICRAIEAGRPNQARLWMERHAHRGAQATLVAFRS